MENPAVELGHGVSLVLKHSHSVSVCLSPRCWNSLNPCCAPVPCYLLPVHDIYHMWVFIENSHSSEICILPDTKSKWYETCAFCKRVKLRFLKYHCRLKFLKGPACSSWGPEVFLQLLHRRPQLLFILCPAVSGSSDSIEGNKNKMKSTLKRIKVFSIQTRCFKDSTTLFCHFPNWELSEKLLVIIGTSLKYFPKFTR